ncbi:MAG TPA: glycosyltransferase domain-containing protein [Candidatus Saccharimonadales bacterium]|nr:glycosyltransferase domain-containing protein [Candidatus Saccharimonadales bacterium]
MPKSTVLRAEFAEISSSRKDWSEAAKRWQEILDELGETANENVYVRLSVALAKVGDFEKANQTAQRGLKSLSNNVAVHVAYARVAIEGRDWSEAAKRWQEILDEFSAKLSPQVLATAASSYRRAGKLKKAGEVVAAALEKYGREPQLLIEQAEITNAQRHWQKSIKRWQTALHELEEIPAPTNSDILLCRFNISVLKRLINIKSYKKEVADYQKSTSSVKSHADRIVIYTAVSKGYDDLKLPEKIDPNFDYVCFTDDPSIDGFGVYDIRPFPVASSDPARTIRYPKTHPHVLFSDYALAIWLDTSIMITGDINHLIKTFKESGLPLGTTPHPVRVSLDEEYMACVNLMKDDPEIMRRQIETYKKEGFEVSSFAENGVLLFNLQSKRLQKALDTWWEQIQKFSKRDQLSFGYSMEKWDIKWYPISARPNNIRNHPDFVIAPHQAEQDILKQLYKLLKAG